MDTDASKAPSLTDDTARLGESISAITFILRKLNERELQFKACIPIFEVLQKEIQSTVAKLKQVVESMDHDVESQVRAIKYLDDVGVVVGNISQFVSILNKYGKGTPDLDLYTIRILNNFTQLNAGLAEIAYISQSQNMNNKM